MVLSQESKYERSGPSREGSDGIKGEGSEDEGDDQGRKKEGWRENGKEKRLERVDEWFPIHHGAERAYGKFARTPEALNDAQVVYRHGCEQERGRVGITYLDFGVVIQHHLLGAGGGVGRMLPAKSAASRIGDSAIDGSELGYG